MFYPKGTRLRVVIEGPVIDSGLREFAFPDRGPEWVQVDAGGGCRHLIYPQQEIRQDGIMTIITIADPDGYPVQEGDVWEKGGHLWFAQYSGFGGALFLTPDDMRVRGRMTPADFGQGTAPVLKWRRS